MISTEKIKELVKKYKKEPIAIIGLGCRLPGGANSPQEFWELLINGTDAISKIPADRWDADELYDADYTRPGKLNVKEGGFVDDIDKFDAQFFEIPPIDALRIDPQQRLLLEVTHQAIEDAGLKLERLSGSKTGVFVGISAHDYGDIANTPTERPLISGSTNTGNANSIAANRISYIFNFKGPSLAIDTACSSSLNAAHLACRSLWAGDCDLAISAGVNAILKPELQMGFSKGGFLAADGRCKSFDAAADGYVRSEGAGAVLLKPLSRALADGDQIYALILGSAINQDGRTTGLPMPNLDSQIEMLKQAYIDAGVDPHSVAFIEAHGTGTKIGDFTEGIAIGTVFGGEARSSDLLVGSVKTNIGHLEAGSGAAGIIKLALTLKNKVAPRNNHFHNPNPKIPFAKYKIKVPKDTTSLACNGSQIYGGINSFGFGGSNAHLVLQSPMDSQAWENKTAGNAPGAQKQIHLFSLSAKSLDALKALAQDYILYLGQTPDSIADICFSAGERRSSFDFRLSIAAYSKAEIRENLQAFLADETRPGMDSNRALDSVEKKIAFVYSGQGPQWWAMGRELVNEQPMFRETINRINTILQDLGWLKEEGSSLIAELNKSEEESRINETRIAQPAIFAIQVALTELWKGCAVNPAGIIGHSIGEVAAAYVSGALSLEEATKIVYHRSVCQSRAEGQGKMLAVGMSEKETRKAITGYQDKVNIAVINGPKLLTLAGETQALEEVSRLLSAQDIFNKFIMVNIPFHSYIMDPLKEDFLRALGTVTTKPTTCPIFSTVTARQEQGSTFTRDYWFRNIRETVQFYPAIKTMIQQGFNTFVEISPHPILATSIQDTIKELRKKGVTVASLRRKANEQQTLFGSLGTLYTWGKDINWQHLYQSYGVNCMYVRLPFYRYQKEIFWTETPALRQIRLGKKIHPHLERVSNLAKDKDAFVWDIVLDKRLDPYIDDHRVQGPIIYPGAGHIDLVLSVARQSFPSSFNFIEDVSFKNALFLPDDGDPPYIQIEIHPTDGSYFLSSRPRTALSAWTTHSFGRINHIQDQFVSQPIDLQAIKKRINRPISIETLYKGLFESGLHLGPSFQAMKQLWKADQESLSEIAVHPKIQPGLEKHTIHPALLDASFQTLFGTMHNEDHEEWTRGVYIPVHIDRIKFYRTADYTTIYTYAKLSQYSAKSAKGDIWIMNPQGEVLLEVQGLECQYLEGSRGEVAGELENSFYEYDWKLKARPEQEKQRQPQLYLASPRKLVNTLEKTITAIKERPEHAEFINLFDPQLDLLSVDYILEALHKMGIALTKGNIGTTEQLSQEHAVSPRHQRLFGQMLKVLARFGYLCQAGDGQWTVIREAQNIDAAQRLGQLKQQYPRFSHELVLTGRCGPFLKEVITGETDPIALIFPEKEWDAVIEYYMKAHSFAIYNDMAVAGIKNLIAHLPAEQSLRILEVGAGTGGMTQAILPLLPADRTEYVYTDLSHMFMLKAQKRFSTYPFLQYQVLDIEKDPQEQGFIPHSFDIIIASDVVHATSQINKTLTHISQLLANKGVLVMLEVTKAPLYLDLIFGMTEGWWLYEDEELRQNHATMPGEKWLQSLSANGFTDVYGATDIPQGDKSSQTLFFARNTLTATTKDNEPEGKKTGKWLLIFDPADQTQHTVAETLLTHFKEQKITAITLKNTGDYRQISGHQYTLNLLKAEDSGKVLAEIEAGNSEPIQGIVYLNAIKDLDLEHLTPEAIATAQSAMGMAFINTAKAILKAQINPRVYAVTTAAQTAGQDHTTLSLAQVSLWGLARTFLNEYPAIKTSIIDLSDRPDQDELANLFEEFWTEKQENEIAFRGKKRFLNKLDRILPSRALEMARKKLPALGSSYHAHISDYGVLDNLVWREKLKAPLAADEVCINVQAAALNFRDIMIVMGLLSNDAIEGGLFGRNLGLECTGTVAAVGKAVTELKPGDKVMAMASDCLSGQVHAKIDHTFPLPAGLSFTEAATIPLVYLTAYYALHYLCRMSRGERILIHAASGGVGIAAINLAQQAGAEIFATAGSQAKMEYLKSLGIRHVYNSRTLEFKDQILKDTQGEGVDIVLNSLSGPAIHQNILCLREYGRFVEIGKTDIYNNSRVGLKAFGNNLAYFAVDVDRLLLQRPALAGKLLREFIQFFTNGTFKPHPLTTFGVSQIREAFRYLSQAKQIGKVVISMTIEPEVDVLPVSQVRFKSDSTYLISGGCSGFGIAIAKWMAEKGAGSLVLTSRGGLKTAQDQELVKTMEALGSKVTIIKADIASYSEVAEIFKAIAENLPPLRGIIHSAMVLEDHPFPDLSEESYMKVVNPKVLGAWNLHKAASGLELEHFIMFSSISSIYGNPAQANYAAANAFLDKLAYYRRSRGLPALTISWGVLGDVGFVARNGKVGKMLGSRGWKSYTLEQSLAILEEMICLNPIHRTAANIDWDGVGKFFVHNMKTFRFGHLHDSGSMTAISSGSGSLKETLRQSPAEKRQEILIEELKDSVSRVLGTSSDKLDIDTPLTKLGLDSLMANQIRNWIQSNIGIDFSLMKVMQGPSLAQLAEQLLLEIHIGSAGSGTVDETSKWLIPLKANPAARLRLVCFAYLGASATVFLPWADELPDDIELYAIQLPKRDERIDEEFNTNAEEMAGCIKDAILTIADKPLIFYGHSFGACLSFIIAHKLEEENNITLAHSFIGASIAPHLPNELDAIFEHIDTDEPANIPEESVIRLLKTLETSRELWENREVLSRFMPAIASDIVIMKSGKKLALGKSISAPLTAIGGENDSVYQDKHIRPWQEMTNNAFKLKKIKGGHMFVHEPASRKELIGIISDLTRKNTQT